MALQRIASRLAQSALRMAGKLTAVNARRLARRAAEKIMKSYTKPIAQSTLAMGLAKTGVKLDPDNALEMGLEPIST